MQTHINPSKKTMQSRLFSARLSHSMFRIMTIPLFELLLTPEDMAAVDSAAAASGIDSFGLMEKAGYAVAAVALRHFPTALRFVVLCGPGNNGGDGYVAARSLYEGGAEVAVFHLGDPGKLKGDAARAFKSCPSAGREIAAYVPQAGDVVIDAIFGAGLSRPVSKELVTLIAMIADAGNPVVAIDLPSG